MSSGPAKIILGLLILGFCAFLLLKAVKLFIYIKVGLIGAIFFLIMLYIAYKLLSGSGKEFQDENVES